MYPEIVFIDQLTLRTLFCEVIPRLWAWGYRGRGKRPLYFFEASFLARKSLPWIKRFLGVIVSPFSFRLMEIRDQEGVLFRIRIPSKDLFEVQEDLFSQADVQGWLAGQTDCWRLRQYLAKAMVSTSLLEPRTLWRIVQTIQVCLWKAGQEGCESGQVVLFLERRPFLDAICRYAAGQGVELIPVRRIFRLADCARRIPPQWKVRVKGWFARAKGRRPETSSGPRIGVEYYGNLHLQELQRNSDLPFWRQCSLEGKDLVVLFDTDWDPLDAKKLSELRNCGVGALAVDPHAVATPDAPLFLYRGCLAKKGLFRRSLPGSAKGLDALWWKEQLNRYRFLRSFWGEIFASQRIKVFLSWFKYTQVHCAIADAMQSHGGISVIYQRAFESMRSTDLAVAADLILGFSPFGAAVEQGSRSLFRYHVAVGYLGDHRFGLLREQARSLREIMFVRGARRIIAFGDENSVEDTRWHSGHELQREHYAFLLEKVLEEPWVGLIIKPKVPKTLRARLGPVAKLLLQAESTGRCFLFEEGELCSAYPPAAAALAADLMIHGHLCAVTAGLESALAGVRTLLLDKEGWPTSPLYRLGVGKVIFHDWPTLWKACLEHWNSPSGTPGFGDWSALLPEFDPFRDGKAAHRMGIILQWLLEGFQAGRSREQAMVDAVERYAHRWGRDKVTEGSPPFFNRAQTVSAMGPLATR